MAIGSLHDAGGADPEAWFSRGFSPAARTHSLRRQGAVLRSLDGDEIREIDYRETQQFLITRDFLNSPERFFRQLFRTVEDPA